MGLLCLSNTHTCLGGSNPTAVVILSIRLTQGLLWFLFMSDLPESDPFISGPSGHHHTKIHSDGQLFTTMEWSMFIFCQVTIVVNGFCKIEPLPLNGFAAHDCNALASMEWSVIS